jgi:NAD(P)-dependent dehydrogenase (short-subunit alcohol dehydrogenase family)
MSTLLQRGALVAAGIAGAWLAMRAFLRSRRAWSFQDRVVLVTGGSRGLGLLMARRLADEGARLAICARDADELARAAAELRSRGAEVVTVTCDLTQEEAVEQMVREVTQQFGPIDVLINNAGMIQVGPYETMTLDDFREAMAVHFWAPLLATSFVLPAMRRRGAGRIVNIASIGGRIAVPHMLPYSASKFALVGLSRGLRAELAKDNIFVTTVCPGLMRTGSHVNARFKGQHRREFTWFSIGASLPIVAMDADQAAAAILDACRFGDAEVNLTSLAQLGVRVQACAPELTAELLQLQNQLLPAAGGIGTQSRAGTESTSRWSPSLLTTLGDRAAWRNNEL